MTSLAHEERTAQDIYNEMSSEDKDLLALILGAVVDEDDLDLSQVPGVVEQYNALSQEKKYLIDFIVGSVLGADGLSHDDLRVDNFLAHFGVKGMKWGVRNADRGGNRPMKAQGSTSRVAGAGSGASKTRAAGQSRLSKQAANNPYVRRELRDKVKGGSATLGEAHQAALKSTGHRVANAFLGDKQYWKGTAIATGVAVAVAATGAVAPLVLPASALMAVGSLVAPAGASAAITTAAGSSAIAGAGMGIAQIGSTVAGAALGVNNAVRAIRGNARIDKSYAALGNKVTANQRLGNKATKKVLAQSGGLRNKNLKQSDIRVGEFLAHFDGVTLGEAKQEL